MNITAQQLRTKYLEFFKSKGHEIIPSASLVPENDATTLFTGSGMQPMLPYLLGAQHPKGTRIADSQKCFRSQDIEEVGDNRHTTFFEMLGNWSLGDYFKKEQLPWMFEFLTKEVGLDPKFLFVTVFRGKPDINVPRDEESAVIWEGLFKAAGLDAKIVDNSERDGIQGGRIFYYPEEKNWWSRSGVTGNMPVGEPGGPDSEMFWDYGAQRQIHEKSSYKDQVCHVNCDCGRFVEIGNNVFMEYVKTAGGFEKLKQQNVDFGGGLERMLAAANGQQSVFDTDIFDPMFQVLELDQEIMSNDEIRKARIIVDHIRASVFFAADGVEPSNKDRGYFLRRLLRRSMVMGKLLNLKHHWLEALMGKVVAGYAESYQYLLDKSENIYKVILAEQKKFEATLEKGLREFEKLMQKQGEVKGKDAFDLYQTYGFPWELTKELAEAAGQKVDREEYEGEFKKHQDLSRTASAGQFKGGLASHSDKIVRLHTATHLMNAALRKVIGEDVWQKGSNITEERTRFDFTHNTKMTPSEIAEVEMLVNQWIKMDLKVKKEIMPINEARKLNAVGVFGEKYADTVSIYTVYDEKTGDIISREFCGGPHVEHTGVIGEFKIQKEEASSAGVRRIKASVF
ncbi:MAG: alanine--tRNA ligase [Candidatus Doudnabacteria bacterium]|nr:alanine--tRNA ligase [Candidatus Doudnabacteria bacterium]